MRKYYIVNQRISTSGESLNPGTPVDTSGWRNVRTLLEANYLREPNSEEDLIAIQDLKEEEEEENVKTY